MILRSYCDESGTDLNSPWITMAAWVSEPARWKLLTRRWKRILKGPPVVREAHAKLMEARQGDFKGWTKGEVEAFRLKLCEQIDRHVRFGVAISVNRIDYGRVVLPILPARGEHAFSVWRDPYAWVMTAIMGLVVRHLKAHERVSFVFDRGHQGQGEAERLFYWVLDADPVVSPRIVRSFQTADSEDFPPLQAADQLVWGCNRGTRLDLPAKRGFIEMRGIPKLRTPVFGGTYAGTSLEKTVANIGAGGPIWGPYTKGVRKTFPGMPKSAPGKNV